MFAKMLKPLLLATAAGGTAPQSEDENAQIATSEEESAQESDAATDEEASKE